MCTYMKKAIFTLAIGDNPMYKAAIQSFRHYAEKVGADLIVSDSLSYPLDINLPKYSANSAWSEKLRIGELLKEYDRVLYLDADILVSPDARNIFEIYSELDTVYMLNEGKEQSRDLEKGLIEEKLGKIDWPYFSGTPVYYNAGVILVSRGCQLFEHANLKELQSICNHIRFYEQTYFNYIMFKNKLKFESLPQKFNYMDMFATEDYLIADFIHYAGKGFSKSNRRRDLQFLKDFSTLYKGTFSGVEIKLLKDSAWQLFLEKVFIKYPLPNYLLKVLSSIFVSR